MKSPIPQEYPPHLHDPLRMRIAVCYAQHEMRKLLPHVRDEAAWRDIDRNVAEWKTSLLLRDFWNGVHGISMGFRLKNIISWVTSLHMQWTEKEVPVRKLWFGRGFGLIAPFHTPESAVAVSEWLHSSANRESLATLRADLKQKAENTAPRNHFPLFVVRKEGALRVVDGNRRLLQAIVDKTGVLPAALGEPTAEPVFFEHWVPTSLLVDLVFWHKRQIALHRNTTEAVARVIAELIRDSSVGRREFAERSIHRDDEADMRLYETVVALLAADGIALEPRQ